jgi:hypothetical protein
MRLFADLNGIFNPGKSRAKITAVNYRDIFITLAPGLNLIKLFWHNLNQY